MPNPNGYDAFIKAGSTVTNDVGDYRDLNLYELQSVVAENSSALRLARNGLEQECRVPLDYSAASQAHLDQLAKMKRLAQAFAAEGRLAEMQNRPNDAAKSYLEMFRLGTRIMHGGVAIDGLVGIAVEAMGVSDLQGITDKLDTKTCGETAVMLETLDTESSSWPEILQQEKAWSRRAFPGFKFRLTALLMRNSLKQAFQKGEQKFKNQKIKTRRLLIDLAARAYELDKGRPPANLADLVPDYLKAIPKDPVTGANMAYSPR